MPAVKFPEWSGNNEFHGLSCRTFCDGFEAPSDSDGKRPRCVILPFGRCLRCPLQRPQTAYAADSTPERENAEGHAKTTPVALAGIPTRSEKAAPLGGAGAAKSPSENNVHRHHGKQRKIYRHPIPRSDPLLTGAHSVDAAQSQHRGRFYRNACILCDRENPLCRLRSGCGRRRGDRQSDSNHPAPHFSRARGLTRASILVQIDRGCRA